MSDDQTRTSHTPGPHWTTNVHINGVAIHARAEDGREVETAFCHSLRNARLYAAAPDMYEALREAVQAIQFHDPEDQRLPQWSAALRKALNGGDT